MTEFTIVGAGLAGTTLAWALVRRGRTVRLIDREPATTSSRVAAGLLTPITGKKPAVSWRWHQLRPAAERFYRAIEAITGRHFFHHRPIVRVMTSDQEREAFRRPEFAEMVANVDPPLNADAVPQPYGAVLMPTAAQLDTVGYLDASREHFQRLGVYERGEWDGRACSGTVLCLGYVAGGTFSLPFRPAKGEILTVRLAAWNEVRVVNRGGWWLAPAGSPPPPGRGRAARAQPEPGGVRDAAADPPPGLLAPLAEPASPSGGLVSGPLYRFGATYSWDRLDSEPTVAGREELTTKLGELVRLPFTLVSHSAGVRPIVSGQRPVIGRHPTSPDLAVFNGLSSKGSLTAPFFAEQLAAHLCDGAPLDPEVDVSNRTQHP